MYNNCPCQVLMITLLVSLNYASTFIFLLQAPPPPCCHHLPAILLTL
jgi:hypothetical protein